MACCIGKTAGEATMCCASSEGRRNADASGALLAFVALPAPEPIALKIASALAPQLRAAFVIDSHDPLTADSERYVLLSVFLILRNNSTGVSKSGYKPGSTCCRDVCRGNCCA